jgi:hypothetical protein
MAGSRTMKGILSASLAVAVSCVTDVVATSEPIRGGIIARRTIGEGVSCVSPYIADQRADAQARQLNGTGASFMLRRLMPSA